LPGLGAGRAARCQIVVVEGPDQGRAVECGEVTVVGSGSECDLVLADERVSRRHLEVRREGERFRVRDLESKNGTLFEGSQLVEAVVGAGATLKLGRSFVRLVPAPEALEVPPSQSRRFGELVAESLVMREVFAILELAANGDVTVLLEGETGTGKELAARGLHDASARRRGPFVAVDCGALPESLVESELFGHVRGAFTGAADARKGAFQRADKGTLFLDELDSVPLPVQARLLRAIEERKVRAVGADAEREVDVRLVAAARRDLAGLVAEGAFRPDLYYRLSVVRVALPALRARREDLAPMVAEMLRRRGLDEPGAIEGDNLDALLAHDWPGNGRELRNVVDRALALRPAARRFAELRISTAPSASPEPLAVRTDLSFADAKQRVTDAFEQRYLADLWARADGNLSEAARLANVDRKHLRTLLRKHGIIED
jgi:DNA-binding NtrC family response regulator